MATQIIRVDKKELVKPFLNYCLTNLQGNRNIFFFKLSIEMYKCNQFLLPVKQCLLRTNNRFKSGL